MISTLPSYYASFSDFQKFFQEGIPILNYHMIAPLPANRLLKGLYVSPKVFTRQLQELHNARFSTTSLTHVFKTKDNVHRHVVISFDDGYQSVFDNAMDALANDQFKAVQFLVPKFLGKSNEWDLILDMEQQRLMDVPQIREWLSAGHEIGSHTLTHPYLTRLSLKQAREEITASKKLLEDLFGIEVKHFCYPYGDYNENVRHWVIEAGYRTASTIRFGINTVASDPFTLCRIKGRHPTRKLRSLWHWLMK